ANAEMKLHPSPTAQVLDNLEGPQAQLGKRWCRREATGEPPK
ncbi:hypothetical protein L195_g064124, partial [Trifolium pratense]